MSKNILKTLFLGSLFVSGLYVKPVIAMYEGEEWGRLNPAEQEDLGRMGYSAFRSTPAGNRNRSDPPKETPEQYRSRTKREDRQRYDKMMENIHKREEISIKRRDEYKNKPQNNQKKESSGIVGRNSGIVGGGGSGIVGRNQPRGLSMDPEIQKKETPEQYRARHEGYKKQKDGKQNLNTLRKETPEEYRRRKREEDHLNYLYSKNVPVTPNKGW